MALKGDAGRGGPMRPIGRGLGGLDPSELAPSHEIRDYLRGKGPAGAGAFSADSKNGDVADLLRRYMPSGVTVRPTGYWSLGILPSVDSTYVKRSWTQLYSGDSTPKEIITTPVVTPQGRVTIVTGFCFFGTLPAPGGLAAGPGRLVLAADYDAYGLVSFNFIVPSGPSMSHWHNSVGTKASELGGIGMLNEGYEDSPIELYIPPNTPLRATYIGDPAPRVDFWEVGFKFCGWECDAVQFQEYVSGSKK